MQRSEYGSCEEGKIRRYSAAFKDTDSMQSFASTENSEQMTVYCFCLLQSINTDHTASNSNRSFGALNNALPVFSCHLQKIMAFMRRRIYHILLNPHFTASTHFEIKTAQKTKQNLMHNFTHQSHIFLTFCPI